MLYFSLSIFWCVIEAIAELRICASNEMHTLEPLFLFFTMQATDWSGILLVADANKAAIFKEWINCGREGQVFCNLLFPLTQLCYWNFVNKHSNHTCTSFCRRCLKKTIFIG